MIVWPAILWDLGVLAIFCEAIFVQHRNVMPWVIFCVILAACSGSYVVRKSKDDKN